MIASSGAGQSLHAKGIQNPYTTVLSIICKTLAKMDDDEMIPAYGFGDKLSRDQGLFSFARGDRPLHKLEGVLQVCALQVSVLCSAVRSSAVAGGKSTHLCRATGQCTATSILEPGVAA